MSSCFLFVFVLLILKDKMCQVFGTRLTDNIELVTGPVSPDEAFSTLGKDFRRVVRRQICLRNKSDGAPLSN